jgi:hypothetical protein
MKTSQLVCALLFASSQLQGQVRLLGIEAVQSVQDVGGSVPLVAGKPGLVRAYLSSDSGPLRINATLQFQGPAGASALQAGPVQILQNADLQSMRFNIASSLNFQIPSQLAAGQVILSGLVVKNDAGAALSCVGCSASHTLQFEDVPALELHVIGFSYPIPNANATATPTDLDFKLIRSWLLRAYPISKLDMTIAISDAEDQGLVVGSFNCNAVNAVLNRIRETEVATGVDPRTHYFGLVPDQSGFMRGCASGIPTAPDPTVVASGPSGSSGFPWDTDGSYADWYTGHELAHTFGRYHPGFCNGNSKDDPNFPFPQGQISDNSDRFIGMDMGVDGVPVALRGSQWTDVMTYCPYEWLSSYTYAGILTRLDQEGGSAAGATPGGQVAAKETPAQSLSVIASINLNKKTGVFQFVSRVDGAEVTPNAGDSRGSIETRDSENRILSTFRTPLKLDTDIPDGEDQTALISAVIPYSANVISVVLKLDGNELARRTVNAAERGSEMASLSATQLDPVSRGKFAGLIAGQGDEEIEHGMLLQWKDSNGAGSSYSVQIGPPEGPLQTLAVAVKKQYYVIKKRALDPYRDKDVKIIVSVNGLSRSQVLSKVIHLQK